MPAAVLVPLLLLTLQTRPAETGPGAPPSEAVAPPVAPAATLTVSERRAAFDEVFEDVAHRYYDPHLRSLPWNSLRAEYRPLALAAASTDALYAVLDSLVARLGDAHTRIRSPLERRLRERNQTLSLGVTLQDLGTAIIISRVDSDQAKHAGITPGDRLTGINARDVDDVLARALDTQPSSSPTASRVLAMRNWLLAAGARPTLTLERLDGSVYNAVLDRLVRPQPTRVTSRAIEPGVLVLAWNRFRTPVRARVTDVLRSHAGANAIVLDLRGNGGGSLQEALAIADLFTPLRLPYGRQVARSGGSRLRRVPFSSPVDFEGRLVVIVDGASASATETFAAALQEAGRAIVVGAPTCGCVLVTSSPRPLPGGGELTVSEYDYFTPRGRRLEGQGVIPDIPVTATREDLAAGGDPVLEAAIAAARTP